jgi:hypothetical protein
MTNEFIARLDRVTGDYEILVNGRSLGRLANCEVAHIFCSDDEAFDNAVNEAFEADYSLREQFAAIRRVYEAREADEAGEAEAERIAEGAWLRTAEYDPEAFDEMVRDDLAGRS